MVPFLLFFALYKHFFQNQQFSFQQFSVSFLNLNPMLILVLIFFSILNWTIETYKWQLILSSLEKISFFQALKSVLMGLTISQVFPYKTGEYLGRMISVTDENKIQSGVLSVWASMSQLLNTLVFGIIALIIINTFDTEWRNYSIIVSLLVLFIAGLVFLFLPNWFNQIKKIKLFSDIKSIKQINQQVKIQIFMMSFFRYLSFIIPYSILIHTFALNAKDFSFFYIMTAVSSIYLLQTIAPSFILTDVMIRMTVPALVLSQFLVFKNNETYLPGMLIYLFNVIIPMIFGLFFLLNSKLKKQ